MSRYRVLVEFEADDIEDAWRLAGTIEAGSGFVMLAGDVEEVS